MGHDLGDHVLSWVLSFMTQALCALTVWIARSLSLLAGCYEMAAFSSTPLHPDVSALSQVQKQCSRLTMNGNLGNHEPK